MGESGSNIVEYVKDVLNIINELINIVDNKKTNFICRNLIITQ